MNGFSLLLTLASLGVVYSWRTGVDQQQEYVLQIEPEIVQALLTVGPTGQPEEIFSDVPPDVGPFQRFCITILPKDSPPARHTAVGEEQFRQLLVSAGRYASRDRTLVAADTQPTILWPGRAGANPEQSYGVTTGWQPDATGNQQYIVQIDPTVLSTLSVGDELYVPIDPAAGRMVRFVVKCGRGNLPRIGGQQTASLTQATTPLAGAPGRGAPAWGNSSAPDLVRQPTRFNNGFAESPAADPRGNQLTSPQNVGPQGTLPSYGNATAPPQSYPAYNPAPTAPNNFDQYRAPLTPGNEPPGYALQPVASQQPQLPPVQRPFNPPFPEARVAGLPPQSVAAATAPLNPGAFSPAAGQQQPDKPWGPLLFVTFALFFSIGGNLYLAYTALEFHSRYRSAIERLRSAARSPQ